MGITQSNPTAAETGFEQNRPPAGSITFLMGPPTDRQRVEMLAQLAAGLRIPPERFWIELVHGSATRHLEQNAGGRSGFDGIVSEALGKPVTVWDVEEALHVAAGRHFLGLIIDTEEVRDSTGRRVGYELAQREVCARIARTLMDDTHAGWTVCTVASRPDDDVFFFLNGDGETRT